MIRAYLLLIPGVGTIVLLLGSALYFVISQSFGLNTLDGNHTATLQHWQSMLSDPVLWHSVAYSLRTSVPGTLGAIGLAYPVALWLQQEMPGKPVWVGILRAPMFVPGLVAAFLMMNVIAYHGILNQFLLWTGVTDRPLRMSNDNFGWGVVILQIWKNVPFALILLTGAIGSIRKDLMDAALDLGATRLARFRQVILPLTIPAMQASAILIFIGALGDFSFASVAGSRSSYSLAMLMDAMASKYYEWEHAAVIALVIMILAASGALLIGAVTQPFAKKTSLVISGSLKEPVS